MNLLTFEDKIGRTKGCQDYLQKNFFFFSGTVVCQRK